MRYISYQYRGAAHVGELEGTRIRPLNGIPAIDRETSAEILRRAPRGAEIELSEVEVLPVSRPSKVIGVGRNYPGPGGGDAPDYPVLFPKFPQSLIGAGDTIDLPAEESRVDYEGEIAVVIGRRGRRISCDDALSHVLGYTLANDVSMRDHQNLTGQWLQGKAWDRSTPVGPAIVTPDGIDLNSVRLRTSINGELVQDDVAGSMYFDVPALIELISVFCELLPGDVILTGSPHGSGQSRDPETFLVDGDRVVVDAGALGTLTSVCRG